MPRGRKLAPLALSDEQREQLLSWTRSASMPQSLALRARIILASAEGLTNTAVAKRLGISLPTVGRWRSRFLTAGLQGLHDEARPGRPRTYDDERVAAVINRALHAKPADSGPWSVRRMAAAERISKSTVQRWFALFGVRPHLAETRKLSNDHFFIEKVRDITALYLNPPDHALVLCADGKRKVQALDRTQPALPMDLGYAEGYRHDCIRHGTTTLLAALDAATGKVITQCRKRHRHREWLSFLRLIDRETPEGLEIHLVCDNCATHKHARVKAWIAKRKRIQVHITRTYASWLNQVERCFSLLSRRAIRRSTFRSVTELKQRLKTFTENYNESAEPFVWAATADSICEKLER